MKLPDLQDTDRALDLRGAPRYPWIALYRSATRPTLLDSVRADLEGPAERTIARVIVQDGNAVRHVLAVTNRGMHVLSLSPKDGEQGLTQRADRSSLAVNLFFDWFRKRSPEFLGLLGHALCARDVDLLSRPVLWSASWHDLRASASAVLLRRKSFPFAAGISYPVRGLSSIGTNTGVRFESDEDFAILSDALDELAPLASERGVTQSKSSRWHQVDLPAV